MAVVRRHTGEPVLTGRGQRLGRVLVVEDEHDVAEMIRYNVSGEGYDVTVVKNGDDAIERVRDLRPEVVDLMVPQLNGWEVCRRLKPEPRARAIPIIMVTGRVATPQDRKHLKVGELEIDRYRFEVRMRGRPVELTLKEFELLAALVGAPGRVFGREEPLDLVWGPTAS